MPSRYVSDRNRPNAHDRGYDRRWKRASSEFLWRHPWCVGCLAIGVMRKAHLVDHVVPHRGDLALFWQSSNWQSLCDWHHNSIKPELERRFNAKRLSPSGLRLDSGPAIALTLERYRPAIGADGFAIPGS